MSHCQKMQTYDENTSELVLRYIDVYDKALKTNKHRFPYKQLWDTSSYCDGESLIEIRLLNPQCDEYFLMSYSPNGIAVKPYERALDISQVTWPVHMYNVYRVIEEEEIYIRNPAKLDWDWMIDLARTAN